MIKFFKAQKYLSLYLSLSILFFLRKGIQYAAIGSYIPLLIIVGFILVFTLSPQKERVYFIRITKIWAILIIIWSTIRLFISIVHLTIKPFDGSFHLSQQFNSYNLMLSIVMLIFGIFIFKSLNKKKLKDGL